MHVHPKPIPLQQLSAPAREPLKPIAPYTSDVQRVTQLQGSGAGRDKSRDRRRPEPRRHGEPSSDDGRHDPTVALATALAMLDLGVKAEEQRPDTPVPGGSSLEDLLAGAVSTREP